MIIVYVMLGILVYVFIAGISSIILEKEMEEDDQLLADFLAAIWPLIMPLYGMLLVYRAGRRLVDGSGRSKDESLLIPGTDRETTDKIVEAYRKVNS